MHILFLTDNFPPEVNAPASRTFEHCRQWVKAGHRVTVITGQPNFPRGKIYDGYRNRLVHRESMEGIRVVRVWTYIAANAGFGRRIADYLSYMVTGFLASMFIRKVDIIVGTSPQFFTACAAWMASVFRRRPFVFELRDLWPESIKAVGAMKPSISLRLLEKLELFLYRRADLIVSVTNSFKRNLMDRGINGDKIRVITNGVDLSRFGHRPSDAAIKMRLGIDGGFVAGYIGTHGMAHGLDTLLGVARRMQDEGRAFWLVLLGDGARKEELQQRAQQMNLQNVRFVDSVPKEDVPSYWSILDVCIIHLRDTPLFASVIPSKLFESMAMGIPVIHCVRGESAEIVRHWECGLLAEPENVEDILRRVQSLADKPGNLEIYRANALNAARQYDRATLANAMLLALEQVAQKNSSLS